MGRGFILQATSKWEEAASVFEEVSTLLPNDVDVGLRAREEHAWCRRQLGLFEECLAELQLVLGNLNDSGGEELNHDRARCLWRIGKCCLEIGGMFPFNHPNLRLHSQTLQARALNRLLNILSTLSKRIPNLHPLSLLWVYIIWRMPFLPIPSDLRNVSKRPLS